MSEPPRFKSTEEFEAYAERKSLEFRRAYGLRDIDPWPDGVLDRALQDYGLPRLMDLPDDPPARVPAIFDPGHLTNDHRWRRERATHLLAHVIIHGGRRCSACRTW